MVVLSTTSPNQAKANRAGCDSVSDANLQLLGMREQTAAFSGYRPQKLPQGCTVEVQSELFLLLQEEIHRSYLNGYRVFIHGMMSGWDILAAEAVLSLRDDHEGLHCVSVAPFKRGYFANNNWNPEWKARALQVYRQSDLAFSLSEHYANGTYYARDRYLVDHASLIIVFFDGKPGGTQYTCDYAAKGGLQIVNVAIKYRGSPRQSLFGE